MIVSLPRRRRFAGGSPFAAAALVAGALAAPPAAAAPWASPDDVAPLAQVGLRAGHLGWDGLYVGMTFDEVSRTVGGLAPPAAEPQLLCPHHLVAATVEGQRLELEFSGTGGEAVLRAILIPLGAAGGGRFQAAEAVVALRERLDLDFVPSPHAPRLAEHEVEKPLYRTAWDELVFVDPEAGVVIGQVCVD
jgi:hypothetical protein